MNKRRILTAAVLMLCLMLTFTGCGKDEEEKDMTQTTTQEAQEKQYVQIEMKEGGKIIVELLPEYAPKTVAFFLELVEDKYYNGLTFHRAVENFMIQGGSPNGDGIGGCGRTVKGEFSSNGIENNLSHTRGVISMARTNVKDSASGQFFIMHGDADYLNGNYAAFGRVVEGMEVVDKIATSPVSGELLIEKPVIKSVKVLKKYTPAG